MATTDFITSLLEFVKTDELKLAAPAIGNFFTSVGANSSQLNIMNQLVLLEAGLLATLPQLEQDVVKQIGAYVQSQLTPAPAPTA